MKHLCYEDHREDVRIVIISVKSKESILALGESREICSEDLRSPVSGSSPGFLFSALEVHSLALPVVDAAMRAPMPSVLVNRSVLA